jgi:pimeloyl-ACP methyl ester carboxylesterase
MGTAASGAPEPELDADTRRLDLLLDKAYAARDAEEINRLETWLRLDGPSQPAGRVSGAARELALEMNAVIIANGDAEADGACGVDAWHRLAEITVPVTVACGDLDVPFIADRCRQLAGRLPAARHVVLAGMAHQPYLESASTVALPRHPESRGLRPQATDGNHLSLRSCARSPSMRRRAQR